MENNKKQKIKNNLIVVMLCLCSFNGMFLTTARAVILGTLLTELNGYQFYSIAVMITSMMLAAMLPIAGKLSDIIGRKKVLMIGVTGYGTAAFVCGTASNAAMFLIGIVFIGIFFGFMNAVDTAIVCDVFEERVRPKYNSFLTLSTAFASLLGPVIGGWCVDGIGWRFVYFMAVPVSAATLLIAWFFLPDQRQGQTEEKGQDGQAEQDGRKDARFDFEGMAAFLLCVIPLLFSLASGGKLFPWISPQIIGCAAVSGLMLISLVILEKKAESPLIPYHLFQNPSYRMCLFLTFFAGFAFAIINYVTLFYQNVLGVSATVSGLLVVPRQAFSILTSFVTGYLLVKTGAYKRTGVFFIVIYGIGMMLMSFFVAGTPVWLIVAAELCFGIGNGGQGIVLVSYAQTTLNRRNVGTGLAFYHFLSSFASSAGAAVGGCVLNQISNQAVALRILFFGYFLAMLAAIVIAVLGKWEVKKHYDFAG